MKESDIRNRDALQQYLQMVREECRTFFSISDVDTVVCPACGEADYIPQFTKEGFDYVVCIKCDTLYARNRPNPRSLNEFYSESKSSHFWVEHFFSPMVEKRREKIFQPRASFLREHFGEDPHWTIGDIGAGFGIFLEELRKVWPESRYLAVEPSSEQARICENNGFEVENSAIEEIGEQYYGKFSLITAFELFEHLYSPSQFIEKVHTLLKPDGTLLLTTLNGQGFDIAVLWENSKSIYPPCHINFFNPRSMELFLKGKGFTIIEIETPGNLDWNIVENEITMGSDSVRNEKFWNIFSRYGSGEAKNELQSFIRKNHLSSHMRVIAKKNTESRGVDL